MARPVTVAGVIPWIQLDTATVPEGGALRLMQRGGEYAIMLDRLELMNSRRGGSEEALASLACEKLRDRKSARVLIGGLGMGFTLRAALAALGPQARVTVAEIVPAIVAWGRGPLASLYGNALTDGRVTIEETDVSRLIRGAKAAYEAILLDVDNGPDGLSRKANDALYDSAGLAATRAALKPGGVLAVWSAGPDRKFSERLRRGGFAVEEKTAHAHGTRGPRHVIWLATKP